MGQDKMNKRRDALKAMMAPVAQPEERQVRSSSGSLKAMGLTLKDLSDEANEARALRAQLNSGAHVIDIDPNSIDPSFVRDRLEAHEGEDFEVFKASIDQDGQQVPVLVRPSVEEEGRYQAAYGHRRIAALKALGRPVRAIVRNLTDEQLVVAQGKENTDRRDLSFIERALFAARLEDRGFSRLAIAASLSLQKGNLSTMVSIARHIPEEVIVAIGAAQKVGRPRWEQLAELLKHAGQKWRDAIEEPSFTSLPSDQRFERIFKAVSRRAEKLAQVVSSAEGRPVASARRTKVLTHLTINNRHVPEFADYLLEQIPEIYAAFQRRKDA